jgi:hypothetical protein
VNIDFRKIENEALASKLKYFVEHAAQLQKRTDRKKPLISRM